jgi:hypothetical protein
MQFFRDLFRISTVLNRESHDVFGELWQVMLQSADNSVVVLLCLFECDDSLVKERHFALLLEREPVLITRYLADRWSFAYRYFMQAQRKQSPMSIFWVFKVLTRAFTDYIDFSSDPPFVGLLHFAMLYIEEAVELFEALVAVFDIDVDAAHLWSLDIRVGDLKVIGAATELAKRFADDTLEKWTFEAIRWTVACRDIKMAYRSIVILRGLQGPIAPSFVPLLVGAVVYHISRHSVDLCDELGLFVGECFRVICQHSEDADVANIAFPFASAFQQCGVFDDNCMRHAMPLFLHCVKDPLLSGRARLVLVDAFLPFASSLETDSSAQRLLAEITRIPAAPSLYLLAAAFLLGSLPFEPVDFTYTQIMELPLLPDQIIQGIRLLSVLLKKASRPLAESILALLTALVEKHGRKVSHSSLVPVYEFAIHRLATFDSAVRFVRAVAAIDPSIAVQKETLPSVQRSLEEVGKQLADIVKRPADIVPITTCEELTDLFGLIDQRTPPKIDPFGAQYEIFLGLQTGQVPRLIRPTYSVRSGMLSRSLVFAPDIQKPTAIEFAFGGLHPLPLVTAPFHLPEMSRDFVVTAEEFVSLNDRTD